ncbi:MAG TPA: hypothetical protein DD407_11425 [Pseudohongiella sp.]|nr:hypothetical protein [Pseudohongiella sp.]
MPVPQLPTDTGGGNAGAPLAPSGPAAGQGTRPPAVSLIAGATSGASGSSALILGIEPQNRLLDAGTTISFNVPEGTFLHSDPAASVQLEASMSDGAPLPGWLQFDSEQGVFTGQAPEGTNASFEIEVIARDSNGSEAAATFTLIISDGQIVEEDLQQGQVGDTPQLQTDGAPTDAGTQQQGGDDQGAEADQGETTDEQAAVGRPGLRDQLAASQQRGLLYSAEQLLELLMGDIDLDEVAKEPRSNSHNNDHAKV